MRLLFRHIVRLDMEDTGSITVYEFGNDQNYTEHAHVEGEQVVALETPVKVTLRPSSLLGEEQ